MKSQARPVTPRDLGITTSYEVCLIRSLRTEIKYKYLTQLGLTTAWLKRAEEEGCKGSG